MAKEEGKILIVDDDFEPAVFDELFEELFEYQAGSFQSKDKATQSDSLVSRPKKTDQTEQETIQQTLESTGYHKTKAAEKLGISRTTLWKKMKKYSL